MDATAYLNSIRNKHKRDYARSYLAWRLGTGEHPDSVSANLTYMAAQAVRMNIDDICEKAGLPLPD